MYDLILRDATIVASTGRQVADVAVQDGRIAYVGPRPPKGAKAEVNAIGKFLMPGVIDTAVQFDPNGDVGIWERESRAAVTGGVTTVLGLPAGERPVVDRDSAIHRIEKVTGRSWTNFGLWGAAVPGNASALRQAADERLLIGTLACMGDDSSDVISADALADYVGCEGVLGVRLTSDTAGKPFLTADALERAATPEILAILRAVREHARPVHMVHLSTAAELDLLDPVRSDFPITTGVTPHHLFLSNEEMDGIHTVPPVRDEQDRRTLWTAVKRGRLDCIASDHHPFRFGGAEPGVPGSELMFPLLLSAVKYGRLSLELLVSLTSEAPARIFGLENKGRIARGADADLILFSEGEVARIGRTSVISGAGWSPYTDREAAPKPDLVVIAGQIVARRGELVSARPNGSFIGV